MKTSPEQLRVALLVILDANRTRFGLNHEALQLRLGMKAINASKEEITAAMEYLAEKNLAEETRPEISRTDRTWKHTEAGIRYVDEHGL